MKTSRTLGVLFVMLVLRTPVWADSAAFELAQILLPMDVGQRAPSDGHLVAWRGQDLWIMDPGRSEVHFLRAVPVAPGGVPVALDGDPSQEGRMFAFGSTFESVRTVPWPSTLLRTSSSPALVSAGPARLWVVDRKVGRIWLLSERGVWEGPREIGAEVISVASNSEGALLLSTTSGLEWIFSSGKVTRWSSTQVEAQGEPASSWLVTVVSGDEVIALRADGRRWRRYSTTGEVRWDRRPPAILRSRAVEGIDDGIASIQGGSEGGVWVRRSGSRQIHRFDGSGEWLETVDVLSEGAIWQPRGLAIQSGELIAMEDRGVVHYVEPSRFVLAGSILDREGNPVPQAVVVARSSRDREWRVQTSEEGSFTVPDPRARSATSLEVRASGFLPATITGPVLEILRSPVVLDHAPVQCVVALDGETGMPVTSYTLQLIRNPRDTKSVGRKPGPEKKIEAPDGRGCVEATWLPPWLVVLTADGYATTEARLNEVVEVEMALMPEARLALSIEDPDGEPVEAASVSLEDATARSESGPKAFADHHVGSSDDSGAVRLRKLGPSSYRMTVKHPEFLKWEEDLLLESGDNEHEVVLSPGATVTVRVFDRQGQTVPESVVELIPGVQSVGKTLQCTTGVLGDCQVTAVPPGAYNARARAEGYAPGFSRTVLGGEELRAEVEVRLRRSVRLTGTIRGRESYPGKSFFVRVGAPGSPWSSAPVDAAGGFLVEDAPTGFVFVLVKTGPTRLLFETVEIPATVGNYDVVLELPTPIRLSGRLLDGSRPCGSCRLVLEQMGGDLTTVRQTTHSTPLAGRYELSLPVAGDYTAVLEDPSTGRSTATSLTISSSQEIDFRLSEGVLTGSVLDGSGEPRAGVRVQVFSGMTGQRVGETLTGALGLFRLEGLPVETLDVSATAPEGVATARVRLGEESSDLELRLPSQDELVLVLRDAVAGIPIPGASILVVSSRGEVAWNPHTIADEEGRIKVGAFDSGPMTLVVESAHYGRATLHGVLPGVVTPVQLHPAPRSFTVETRPEAGAPCSFELRGLDGRAVALAAQSPPGPVSFRRQQGFFTGLSPGSYVAILRTCGGQRYAVRLDLQPGVTPRLTFPE